MLTATVSLSFKSLSKNRSFTAQGKNTSLPRCRYYLSMLNVKYIGKLKILILNI